MQATIVEKTESLINSLESRQLNVLEKRRSRWQACRIEKRRVKNPVSRRRTVNIRTAFECAVVIMCVVKINQRTGIIQSSSIPIFKKAFEIVNAARQTRIAAALIGGIFITASRIAGKHRKTNVCFSRVSLIQREWIAETS